MELNRAESKGNLQINREAKCSCGQLMVRVVGDPKVVVACSCRKCQRRTGSVFGVSSYFEDGQLVEITGESQVFETATESGRASKRYFCPYCGTAVYWKGAIFPGHTGIPVGAFADPDFPDPMISVWNESKHGWVRFPDHWISSDTQDIDPALIQSMLSQPD